MLFNILQKSAKHLKKDKPEEKYYLALDIGTEVLKALVFSTTNLGVDIWASYHLKQQVKAMRSGVVLDKQLIIQNIRMVLYKIKEEYNLEHEFSTAVLGMAGELVNGISITVDYDRHDKKDEAITQEEAEFIRNEVFSQIEREGRAEMAARMHSTPGLIEILHLSITGIELDGRREETLVGAKGRNVRLYIYASFAPKKYVDVLYEVLDRVNLKVGAIVVQPFAIVSAYAGSKSKNFSGLFVDIGGGTTDVALVENGSRIQTQMFAFGGRAFSNRIAKEFHLPFNLAEERKLKYSAGELPLEVKDQLRQVIIPDARLWVDALRIALEELDPLDTFPPAFYLCGGGALLPDIKEIMLTYAWTKHLPFAKQPKVELVTPDSLDKVYDKTGLLVNPYDVTPASLARFYWDTLRHPFIHKVNSRPSAE